MLTTAEQLGQRELNGAPFRHHLNGAPFRHHLNRAAFRSPRTSLAGALLLAIALLGAACGSSVPSRTKSSQPHTAGRASLLTYGIVPPQLPPPTRLRAVVNAVKELAGAVTVQVHLYTEWNTYPSSLPGLDAEIASYASAGEHVDLALVDAPPAGAASNPQGFATFVAAMVTHFADQHAVTRIQVTNEPNNAFTAAAVSYGQTPIAALVSGIEAGAAAKARARSHAALGFNWFYSFGSASDIAWWKALAAAGGKRFAANVQWVGIDLYPGTYVPGSLPPPGSGHLASTAAADVAGAIADLRTNLMPLAGLGRNVPIGISEIGWATHPPARPLSEQAELVKAFTAGACSVAAQDHVGFMTWFELANNAIPTRATPYNEGLMDAALTPQPAFAAYQAVIHQGCPVSGRERT